MDLTMMERVGDRWEKMEGSGQSLQRAVVSVEEEEDKMSQTQLVHILLYLQCVA
jgi:hypothetical protein